MRRTRLTTALALGFVAAATLGSLPASAADLSDAGSESIADIAACAAESDHLLASIVVDSSGSLRETDPSDLRVGAVMQALNSLEQLQRSNESITVQASLATFGTAFEPVVGWGTVESGHAQSLKDAAEGILPQRDNDQYTDYRAALLGAQSSLNAQAASLGGVSCKILFWFTDGKLDVGAQTESARSELCAPQGIVDSVRADKVAVVALALFVEGGPVTVQERERLRAIVEGVGEGESCGTVPIPSSSSPGAYLRAADASSMRRLFAQATSMIEGATPALSTQCPSAECAAGRLEIPLDSGITGFRVILERAGAASVPTISGPDGQTAPGAVDTTSLSGSDVVVTDVDGLMTIDVRDGSLGASGTWHIEVDPSSTTLVDLYYLWGATLAISASDDLVVGEEGTVNFTLVDASGTLVDPDNFASLALSAVIDGTAAALERSDEGWTATVDLSTTDATPVIRAEATARAVTAENGIRVGPVSASADLETRFAPRFPTLETSRLALPAIVGDGTAEGQIHFRGSAEGATRACIEATRMEGPDAAGQLSLEVPSPCVDIPAGTSASLSVALSTAQPADGRIDGEITIRLEGVDGSDTVTTAIPFGASMTRPVNEPLRWALVAGLTGLALLIAWAVAEISRRIGDRFTLSLHSRVASVPVVLTSEGVVRIPPQPHLLEPAVDFKPIVVGKRLRAPSFSAGGLDFGVSFPLANPLASARPWAQSGDGSVVTAVGAMRSTLDPKGHRAPVRLPGSVDSVLVIEAPDDLASGEFRGRLVVIVDSRDGVASALKDRLDDIEATDWNQVVESVTATFEARRSAPPARAKRGRPAEAPLAPVAEAEPIEDGPPALSWDSDTPATFSSDPTGGARARSPKPDRRSAQRPPTDASPDAPPPSPINFWD